MNPGNSGPKSERILKAASFFSIFLATVLQLRLMGRFWWCSCGKIHLWAGDVLSSHNSQHLFDPYSFTHILHGFCYCALLFRLLPSMALSWRFCLAVFSESCWEVLENSAYVINRYRAATSSLGYSGDAILNSMGDILCCSVGFWFAWYLGFRKGVVVFILTEAILLLWIRDSLLLNIIMLISPVESIKAWQMGL